MNCNKIKRVRSAFAFTNRNSQSVSENNKHDKFRLSLKAVDNSKANTRPESNSKREDALYSHQQKQKQGQRQRQKLSSSLINKWLINDHQQKAKNSSDQQRPLYSSASWRTINTARSQQKLCKLTKQNSSPAIKLNLIQKINRLRSKQQQKKKKFIQQQTKIKQHCQRISVKKQQQRKSQIRTDIDLILNKWQKQYVHLKERYTQRLRKGYHTIQLGKNCDKKWSEWFMMYK